MKERISAGRMMVIWPLLTIFILFASWGLSDPNLNLPASIVVDSAYDVMYVASAFILLSATMGAVLISFDGISRDRLSASCGWFLQPLLQDYPAWVWMI